MTEYPIHESLYVNPAKNCVALVITPDFEWTTRGVVPAAPSASLRSGTLTFLKSEGRTFAITCHHVIQAYRDMSAAEPDATFSMRTMLNGFHVVMDRFVRPQAEWPDAPPDIGIREVNPAFIECLGKTTIDLDSMMEPPAEIQHAYAVGFPEEMKQKRMEESGDFYRVSMPQVEILAELPGRPSKRFTMASAINHPPPHVLYSGMSGGPIFWSTDKFFGILGIIYEGGKSNDNTTIYVFGEIATPTVIRQWISNYDDQ